MVTDEKKDKRILTVVVVLCVLIIVSLLFQVIAILLSLFIFQTDNEILQLTSMSFSRVCTDVLIEIGNLTCLVCIVIFFRKIKLNLPFIRIILASILAQGASYYLTNNLMIIFDQIIKQDVSNPNATKTILKNISIFFNTNLSLFFFVFAIYILGKFYNKTNTSKN